MHKKRNDELKSSKYNYISSFLPSYSQNNDYANSFDALSKSLTNISCKIKSNDSDLKYLSNRLKLSDQYICDINQMIQQRLVKRNPFTDHRKFVLDSQRATHVVKMTK